MAKLIVYGVLMNASRSHVYLTQKNGYLSGITCILKEGEEPINALRTKNINGISWDRELVSISGIINDELCTIYFVLGTKIGINNQYEEIKITDLINMSNIVPHLSWIVALAASKYRLEPFMVVEA